MSLLLWDIIGPASEGLNIVIPAPVLRPALAGLRRMDKPEAASPAAAGWMPEPAPDSDPGFTGITDHEYFDEKNSKRNSINFG